MGEQTKIVDKSSRRWHIFSLILLFAALGGFIYLWHGMMWPAATAPANLAKDKLARTALEKLPVKEASLAETYNRDLFLKSWARWKGCNVRQKILARDLTNITLDTDGCTVTGGKLNDPYSGKVIELSNKSQVSSKVQIDHVVALSNAWQTGAQTLNAAKRNELANDDLELIAVSVSANQDKSDGDASAWLPPNKAFRCQYVARQIAVKLKYKLWITSTEAAAIKQVLSTCPYEMSPVE